MKDGVSSNVAIKGFYRLQIKNQDGTIAGDSGWNRNMITNLGFQYYVVELMGNSSGSLRVSHAALGTGAAPASNATALAGEISGSNGSHRQTVTFSEVGSKTAQYVGTFASGASFVTQTENISNVGLFAVSTEATGQIFAGNNYTSSSVATNQSVNLTYQIRFATA
jgi:hypothetical protein